MTSNVSRDTLASRVKSPLLAILPILLWLLSPAFAQERHNSLAIDEQLNNEVGPYYFIEYGDSANAYAKAAPFAEALGLDLEYDNSNKILTFQGNGVTARIEATSNVKTGLEKRSGVLDANGRDVPSPMAIIVDGVSYVAIVPIAKAFGCEYGWHSQYRLITVDLPRAPPQNTAQASSAAGAAESTSVLPGTAAVVEAVRVGVHDDYTRVAIDMGDVADLDVAVHDEMLIVSLGANAAVDFLWEQRDENVKSVYFTRSGERPALVVRTRHTLTRDGTGFRQGRTDSNTVYFDFAPQLEGEPVSEWLAEDAGAVQERATGAGPVAVPVAAAPARPVVVIDAGHGGKFAGTRNGGWKEEEIVLNVALAAKSLLEANGVDVILTRDSDDHLSSDYYGDLSARAEFATPERNLFVSIHANAASNRSAQGIETYVFGQPLDKRSIDRAIEENGGENRDLGIALTNESIRVANETSGQILRETQLNYSRRLAYSVHRKLVGATGARDRGVKQNAFFVIQNARTPAILVELGFVSNPEEGRKLASEGYQARLAKALVDGILEFLATGGTIAAN